MTGTSLVASSDNESMITSSMIYDNEADKEGSLRNSFE